ncbi:MAG: hypothetical protein J0H61_11790 [Alphaproteobacteria bacterium]|nr:hypothetical protein [Alphaproteobacteria bacterium]
MSATRPTPSKFSLPTRPSLEHLRKMSKQRLAKLRAAGASAQLADAQLLLAREYGFSSWRALKAAVGAEGMPVAARQSPLNHYRVTTPCTAKLDRVASENAFFSLLTLGLFLTCMAMTVDFGSHKPTGGFAPVVVDVEIKR